MKNKYSSNISKAYLFKFLVQFHLIGGVLIPFFTDWGGLTFSQTLLLQSWFLFWTFVLEVPTGAVADYIGRKQSIYIGAGVMVLAALVYSSYPALPVFLLGEFLWAAAFAFFSGADEAFLYDTLKHLKREVETNKIIARYESWGIAGLVIAAPIGSIIASLTEPRITVLLMAIPFFLAMLVGMSMHEPPQEKDEEIKRYPDLIKKGLSIIKGRKKIQWILLDLGVVHSLSFYVIWLYQPLLSNLGIGIAWFGVIHALITGSEILVMNIYPKLEKSFGSVGPVLSLSVLVPGLMFIIAGISASWILLIPAVMLIGGFGMTRRVLISRELNSMIPSAQRATVLSFAAIARRFGNMVLNPAVGRMADSSVNRTVIILGFALISFAVLRQVVFYIYSRRPPKLLGVG